MSSKSQKNFLQWFFKISLWIFCIIFFSAIFSTISLIYTRYPLLYERILELWPIGVLILSIFLQYFFFETKFSGFLFLAGFFFVIGLMFNINLHNSFYNDYMLVPIAFLALAASLLNYYIFKRRNIYLIPFILLLTILSILLLLAPLFASYLSSGSLYLYLIIIVIVTAFSLLKRK